MRRHVPVPAAVAAALLLSACTTAPARPSAETLAALADQVRATETAFAKTMADRDLAAFASHLADDAVFVNGRSPLHGRDAIAADWSKYFSGPAPFSWRPETVVVLADGTLAQTKGPVFDPAGKTIAEFRSTWRQEAPGVWKIVFDDGACVCPPRPQP